MPYRKKRLSLNYSLGNSVLLRGWGITVSQSPFSVAHLRWFNPSTSARFFRILSSSISEYFCCFRPSLLVLCTQYFCATELRSAPDSCEPAMNSMDDFLTESCCGSCTPGYTHFLTWSCCGSCTPGYTPLNHFFLQCSLLYPFPIPTHPPACLHVFLSPRGQFGGQYLLIPTWSCGWLVSFLVPHEQRQGFALSSNTAVNWCPILPGGSEYQIADCTASFFRRIFHIALSRTPPVRCFPLLWWGKSP